MMSYIVMMSAVAGVITMLMAVMLFGQIDCDSLSDEELQSDCKTALNTSWVIVALLPILMFFVIYQVVGGRTASFNVINIQNVEERTKKMQRLGVDHILKKCKATIIDCSKRGNELYELGVIPNYPLKYLKYEDPSTANKIYGCFVPSDINIADEAMGWKWDITEEEYKNDLIYEA